MQQLSTDILITGAGPSGLLLAIQLAEFGTDFLIIDKMEHKPRNSGALVIHAATLELLAYMGLLAEVMEEATPVNKILVKTENSRSIEINARSMVNESATYPPLILLEQYKLEKILRQKLTTLGKKLLKGTLQVLNTEESQLEAIVKSEVGVNFTVKARYIIGADGKNSTTRELMKFRKKNYRVGNPIYIMDYEGRSPVMPGEIMFSFLRKGSFGIFPLRSGYTRMDGSFPIVDSNLISMEGILAYLPDDVIPERVSWFSVFYGNYLLCDDFRKGAVFLIGDAAHTHNPVGGQGMNSGLQDAHNLAWKLDMVIRGIARSELLDTYTSERMAVVKKIMDSSTLFFRYTASFDLAPSFIRFKLLPLFSGMVKRLANTSIYSQRMYNAVSQLWIRHKALSSGNIRTYGKYEQGQLFRNHDLPIQIQHSNVFILLIFLNNEVKEAEVNDDKELSELQHLPIIVYSLTKSEDKEGLFARIGIYKDTCFLLRPDFYIAMISHSLDPKVITGYFNKINIWQGS